MLALSCAIAVWMGSDSIGSAAEPDLAEQLAAWKTLSADEKHEMFYGWADALIDELTATAERSNSYSEIIYGIQIRTNVLLTYAFDRKDQRLLQRLGELYLLPLEHLQEADPAAGADAAPVEIATWVDPGGRVRVGTASQFLYVIAYTIRRSQELSDDERPAVLDDLANSYAPVLREHLKRWIYGEPGAFSVRGWGCDPASYHHADFVERKRAYMLHGDKLNAPLYCNALGSTDIWIITATAEAIAAQAADQTLDLINQMALGDFEAYRDEGVALIFERFEATTFRTVEGHEVDGLDFDPRAWLGYPDHRYSGYSGTLFPEDNAAIPTRNPNFSVNLDNDWMIEGDGVTRWIKDPVFSGGAALRIDLEADEVARVHQALLLNVDGRLRGHVHRSPMGTALVEARLIVGGDETVVALLKPADVRLEDWERLETVVQFAAPADVAELEIVVTGPGYALIDEARVVSIDAATAERPIAVVEPAFGTGARDISHARRLVQLLETLDALELIPLPLTNALKGGLARQLAYGVFNGTLDEPSFANYLDGTDGWYRVNYVDRVGFGYAPGQQSTAIINGGYCRWSKHDERLREICTALWTLMQADPFISPAFATCHMSGFIASPCGRLAERALNLVASLDLLPPLSENRVH